jgi:hypothetical protein
LEKQSADLKNLAIKFGELRAAIILRIGSAAAIQQLSIDERIGLSPVRASCYLTEAFKEEGEAIDTPVLQPPSPASEG